jgi:hypothetical protein
MRTRFIWDFLKLSLLSIRRFFLFGMRMSILIAKSICLSEEPCNRCVFEVVGA